MRKRAGYVHYRRDKWWARITYRNEITGKRDETTRCARTRVEATDLRDQMLRDFDESDGRALEFEHNTVADLCKYYKEHYARPAEYVDGRKVAGLRSFDTIRGHIDAINEYFGERTLRSITYEDVRRFKLERLRTLTRHGGQRSIATVNRELSSLKRMFGIALRESWILRNPFAQGDTLISLSDEHHRETILTIEDERRLLEACDHEKRQHLRPILICALDTGMRQGEIFKLRWSDVDLDQGSILVRAFNTKTMRSRQVAITDRLSSTLSRLFPQGEYDAESLVFGVTDNVKRSFAAARSAAGLPKLRFHDLRHTAATRLANGNLPITQIGRILGHTQPRTTYRYVNADDSTARRAAEILNTHSERVELSASGSVSDAVN